MALGGIPYESVAAFPGRHVYKSAWWQYPHVPAFPERFANQPHLSADALRSNVLTYERLDFWAFLHEQHIS